MKACVVIIFIVIQAITCEKAVSKLRKKLMVPKMNEECKKIKCPSVEEPLCVKMTRRELGRNMHIVVANRCEMDYMKCHDDVEAKIVPMKYCGHNAAPKVGKMKNKMRKHIRVKRMVASTMSTDIYNDTSKIVKHAGKKIKKQTTKPGFKGKIKRMEMKKARIYRKKLARMLRNNVISKVINKYSVLNDINRLKMKHGADQHGRQKLGPPYFSSETDGDWEQNERFKIKKGIGGHEMTISEDAEPSPNDFFSPNVIVSAEQFKVGWGDRPHRTELNDVVEIEKAPLQSQHLDDFDMFSRESTNGSNESFDNTEYDSLCPTVCPSRDVMVCGRNQHGIYRTFLSICHMKMFSCNHQDDVLELVSREPCLLSAPLLSEERMQPKGVLREEGDDDKILRYLICKERGVFAKGPNGKSLDPRCNFPEISEDKKYYDYKGVIVEMGPYLIKQSDTSEY